MTASFLSRFDEFHDQAMKATGFTDFGSTEYVEPMKILLSDYDKYGRHTPFGEQYSEGGMVSSLIARLFAQQGFKAHPEFLATPIKKPIVIVGLPRSGSTTLQRLLCQDPETQYLVPWLGNAPRPRPPRETWESDPWFQITQQTLDFFCEAFPHVKVMHPMRADLPDECRWAIAPSFWWPITVDTGMMDGDYPRWALECVPHYAYEHYRKVLGLIAGGDQRRWILKDPTTHSWAPQVLDATFPDALYVYTHRNPLNTLTSVCQLEYPMHTHRQIGITREVHAQQALKLWSPAWERLDVAMSAMPSSRVFHLHNTELSKDPVGACVRLYEHFGIPVTETVRQAWQKFIDIDARAGHGTHSTTPESFGLRAEDVYAALPHYWANYKKRYGEQ